MNCRGKKEWKLSESGYSLVVGDDTNTLAAHLVEDQLLPKLSVQPLEDIQVKESKTFSRPTGYPNGLVQPGMVIYAHRGNMIMHWEAKVEKSNVYGAANRPLPEGTLARFDALGYEAALLIVFFIIQMFGRKLLTRRQHWTTEMLSCPFMGSV